MKKFLSENWRKIIYVICGIAIAIDLFFVVTTPALIPEQFYKYGPTVESDIIDKTFNPEIPVSRVESISNEGVTTSTETISAKTASEVDNKPLILGAVLVMAIVILATLLDKATEGSDGKKK